MLGPYEHRRIFAFRYSPVFEVHEDGILYKSRKYGWSDIDDTFQNWRGGLGGIRFKNGTRCLVNLRTFRKTGDKPKVSFHGRNEAFHQIAKYIFGKQLDALKDPKIDILKKELDQLEKELASTDNTHEHGIIEKKLMRVTRELLDLEGEHLEKARKFVEKKTITPTQRLVILLIVSGLIVWLIVHAWKSIELTGD